MTRMMTIWSRTSLIVAVLSSTGLLHAQVPDVQQLLMLTNQDRAAQGLGPLRWSRELAEAARAHDEQMVQRNELQHQFPGEPDVPARAGQAGAHFRAIAENIAYGPDVADLERQWMHSAPHRANILDPQMDSIGIALIRAGGALWAVEDFSHVVAAVGPADVEERVISLLSAQGMQDAKSTEDARQTCGMPHGSAGATRPRFIMRWESSEINRLPDILITKLQSGQFRTAAVGVCDGAHLGQGFTTYRVAVLLY